MYLLARRELSGTVMVLYCDVATTLTVLVPGCRAVAAKPGVNVLATNEVSSSGGGFID